MPLDRRRPLAQSWAQGRRHNYERAAVGVGVGGGWGVGGAVQSQMCKTRETGEREAVAMAVATPQRNEMKKVPHDVCSLLDKEVRRGGHPLMMS